MFLAAAQIFGTGVNDFRFSKMCLGTGVTFRSLLVASALNM